MNRTGSAHWVKLIFEFMFVVSAVFASGTLRAYGLCRGGFDDYPFLFHSDVTKPAPIKCLSVEAEKFGEWESGRASCHTFKLGISSEQDARTTRILAIIDINVN